MLRGRTDGMCFAKVLCLLEISQRKKDVNDAAFLVEIGAYFSRAVEDFAMSNILRKIKSGEK